MIEKKDDVRAGMGESGHEESHGSAQGRLTEAILSGALAPGTRLDERRLADVLDVGAAEIHRALGALAAAGLIAVRRDGTHWVTALDGDRVRDAVAMFGDVWIGSVRHTMATLHEDDLAYLSELVDDVARAVRLRAPSGFGTGLRALAVAFARIEGNTERAELLASLGTLLECFTRRAGAAFDWSSVRFAVARIGRVLPARDAVSMRTALIDLFDEVLPEIVDRAVAQSRPLVAAC
ncbi:GntR family transcriptional regulator [Zhihengliuella sp. ISTPL4]|uniref:GntR family transcriptional regulator n=1 Tax=Zhihengliuella sp. ISTPL4 TaxID=2058657 RepID=UPI000C7CDFA2|nr:GntR family transcriptional regulator [Zhihengliuella sp. ISTPL4]